MSLLVICCTLSFAAGTAGRDTAAGTAGRDTAAGTAGRDTIDLSSFSWRAQLAGGGVYPTPPPAPDCEFYKDVQLYDPGSKHTKPPVPAIDEDACCQVCMADSDCFGAELYGQSCYVKTASLPHVKQVPPAGVLLVACVCKNRSIATVPHTVPAPVVVATVPGDILAALERSDKLGIKNQSIYFGTNLKVASVQAAQNASYWLNSTIPASAEFLARGRHTLIVDGLDYNATLFVNGKSIGSHAGPYKLCQLAIDSRLLAGSNELSILFHLPPHGELAPSATIDSDLYKY
jgi:hypothetical protein